MAGNKRFPLVRGRRMRATRLDTCGRIPRRACSAIVTKGFISVAMTANIDEGEEIAVQNAAGETCVRDAATPSFTGYGVQITFCDVDPQLYAMMTNQSVVFDNEGTAVGFRVNSGRAVTDANFALELWSGVPGVACEDPNAQGSYGYFLLPFVSGGILGDFTLENGAVTFTLQNAATKDGTAWGKGPYNVVLGGSTTNEQQTVTITGTPTGGNFTLTYAGQTTANIAYNAAAAAVKTALENLSNIESGDITVTGGPGPGTPYVVTFGGSLQAEDVAQMTATSALTGGSSPAVAVTTTTPGVGPVPVPLLEALDAKDHLHVQYTTVAPPEPSDCIPYGVAATGATMGAPATLTPADSYPPETFAALTAAPLTATPSTAWTTGKYVVLGNGSHAYWNGTAWVAGDAP